MPTKMPSALFPSRAAPVMSVPMRLPSIRLSALLATEMPEPLLPEMRFRSAGLGPPTRKFGASCAKTARPFGTATVPETSVPMKQPARVSPSETKDWNV